MIDRQRLEAILREAGQIALAGWPGDGHAPNVWHKSPDNPVSEYDLAVDAFLKQELSALLPAAGWLSEETTDASARLRDDLVWVVDPIDGTRDFIRGRDGWAVSVALISSSRPLLGYLYAPARYRESGGDFWHAEAGKGAWRNGERLVASKRRELEGSRVPATPTIQVSKDLVGVDHPNSIALRMAMVASNEADFVAALRWGFEWDIAAAGLIAREAGAAVTDAFGNPFNFNKRNPRVFGLLVTAPAIHCAAMERLADRAQALSKED